jgi:hypothetical protein
VPDVGDAVATDDQAWAIEQDRRALELLEIGHAASEEHGARSIEISSSRPSPWHRLAIFPGRHADVPISDD